MSDQEELHDERPKNLGPTSQEARKGHTILNLGDDLYAEVSKFKGRTYASIRRWFQADDGKWYRTKNGLNITMSVMTSLLDKAKILESFYAKEAEHPWESDDA